MTDLKIEKLGHRGDGIAAGPVYVSRTLPGERVNGEVDNARVVDPKIETPSPDRISPRCRHYNSCGGCGLHHASDDFIGRWKKGIVREALAFYDIEAPIEAIHTSPVQSRRRATLSGRRTKKGALVGFHAPASEMVTSIPDCLILRPALLELLPYLQDFTRNVASRKGELKFAVTETETGLDVAVSGGRELELPLRETLAVFSLEAGLARLVWDEETVAMSVQPTVRFGEAPIPLPPGAFLQATKEGEASLQEAVASAVKGSKRIMDLFSGCGTFALTLAKEFEVHAVEGDPSLVSALDAGWRHASNLQRVTTEKRDLFRRPVLVDELHSFDAVVVDPPRAGAEAQISEIAKARVPKIASVSCNPTTFARDSAILTRAGYKLTRIDVIDQFRWSPHVEVAGAFLLA